MCFCFFCFGLHPGLGTWTAYWSALSFDSPMREYTGLCTIRSMAQTLCYDLARAEKAKDEKKKCGDVEMWLGMLDLAITKSQIAFMETKADPGELHGN